MFFQVMQESGFSRTGFPGKENIPSGVLDKIIGQLQLRVAFVFHRTEVCIIPVLSVGIAGTCIKSTKEKQTAAGQDSILKNQPTNTVKSEPFSGCTAGGSGVGIFPKTDLHEITARRPAT
jgi:hypothetical protein